MDENAELRVEMSRLTNKLESLNREVSELRGGIEDEQGKYRRLWRDSCQQLAEYDVAITEKESEIEVLKACVLELIKEVCSS